MRIDSRGNRVQTGTRRHGGSNVNWREDIASGRSRKNYGPGRRGGAYMEVKGMAELQEFFNNVPWKVAGNIQRKAIRAALTPIVKAYRRNLKGAVTASGTGKALGKHTGVLAKLQTTGKKVKGYKRSATVIGLVGPKAGAAPHAHLVEYGTAPRRHKSGKYVGAMPAYAPLRKAFDHNLGEVKRILRTKLRDGIAAEMKKLSKATRRAR